MLDVDKNITTDGGDYRYTTPPEEDGEGGPRKNILISNIIWDLGSEEIEALGLPVTVKTSLEEVEAAEDPYADEEVRGDIMHMIGDWLTSTYHGNLSDFDYTFI